MRRSITPALLYLLLCTSLFGQGTWLAQQSLPAAGRWGTCEFVIGDMGYTVGGRAGASNDLNETYAFNTTTNAWQMVASLPGSARRMAAAFTIAGKGYVTCGVVGSSNMLNDMWEYDPSMDSWTQKASLPAAGRYGMSAFVINGIGYILGGNLGSATGPYTTDLWSYDPVADQWQQRASLPSTARYSSGVFVVDGKGHITGGRLSTQVYENDHWMYDPSNDTWTSKADLPVQGRSHSFGWSIGDRGLICGGHDPNQDFDDCWSYNPYNDAWSPIASYPGSAKWVGASMNIQGRIFAGFGLLPSNVGAADFWELREPYVGMGEHDASATLLISPNPCVSGGTLNLRLGGVMPRNAEFIMHNNLGQVVHRAALPQQSEGVTGIVLPVLGAGTYTVSIFSDGEQLAREKCTIIE